MEQAFNKTLPVLTALSLFLVLCSVAGVAQLGTYQQGTVVRMRMGDCLSAHRGLAGTITGGPAQFGAEACPEYTLVSDKVVFVIVGRSSDQLIPLADTIDFRFHKNEMAVRLDDAKHESKFGIKEMILRSEWEKMQRRVDEESSSPREATEILTTRNHK